MQFSLPIGQRGVSVLLEPPAELYLVRADISLIERALTNLLKTQFVTLLMEPQCQFP